MSAELDDFDLQEAWDRACASFAKTAEGKCGLKDVDLGKGPIDRRTPTELVDQIAAHKADNEEQQAKHRTARDVVSKTAKCVQTLADLAAQPASSASPGAAVCCNAVSYLITAGRNYSKIFSSLEELFSRVSEVLERFVVYLREDKVDIDLALRKILVSMLLSFVSICELSIRVLHENRVKKFLKVILFSDDEGVMGEYDKLRNLCDNELQMKTTLTYQTVKQSQRALAEQSETLQVMQSGVAEISSTNKEGFQAMNTALAKIEKSQRDRDLDKARRGQREKVERAVGSDRSKAERSVFEAIRNAKVDRTGSWLHDEPVYQTWASTNEQDSSLLLLSGKEGFGKSYLTVGVIQDLTRRKAQAHDRNLQRILLAYVFFSHELKGDRSQHSKETRPISDALLSIIWQLCDDTVFLKEFSSSLDDTIKFDPSDDDQVLALFTKVLISLSDTNTSSFLLFDGIDHLDDKHSFGRHAKLLSQMLHIAEAHQHSSKLMPVPLMLPTDVECTTEARDAPVIRLCGSGVPSMLNEFTEGLCSQIFEISKGNNSDLEAFIEDRISRMSISKGQSDDVRELRATMPQQLIDITKGDFKNLEMLLDQISAKQRPSEIREALEKAQSGDTRIDTIDREIQQLNESLSNEDIRDLNELLLWALGSFRRTMTAAELEASLYLQNNEANFSSLVDRLRTRFSVLFTVDAADDNSNGADIGVCLKSESHREFLNQVSERQAAQRATTGGVVFASEIRMMKRVLRQFCDQELYEKFGFEGFFQQKTRPDDLITVGVAESHLQILYRCLKVIHDDRDALDPLRSYSIQYFPDHLAAIDLSLSDPVLKAQVGKLLIPLLIDDTLISRWWVREYPNMRVNWLCDDDDEYISALSLWLRDTAVTKLLEEDQKDCARQLAVPSKAPVEALSYVAKYMATRWLDGRWHQHETMQFTFLYAYLSKLKVSRTNEKPYPTDDDRNAAPTATLIKECRDWALEQLETDLDHETLRNVARTMREYGFYEDAIQAFQRSASMVENNWLIQAGLADTYALQGNYDEAVKLYNTSIPKIISGEALPFRDAVPADYLSFEQQQLGQCFVKLGKLQDGLDIFEEVFKRDPKRWEVVVDIINIRKQRGEFTEIIKFLQETRRETSQDEPQGSYFNQLFWMLSHRTDWHEAVFAAARMTDSVFFVKDVYVGVITAARALNRSKTYNPQARIQILGFLLYFTACYLFEQPFRRSNEAEAIALWEEILHLADHQPYGSSIDTIKYDAVKKLCGAYIGLAKAEEYDSPASRGHLEKLEALALDEDFGSSSQVDVHLLLARYLVLMGQHAQARDLVKGHMKVAFDLLSNADPSDDWQGFQRMGITLNFLGNEKNGLAAFSLITPMYFKYNNSLAKTTAKDGESNGDVANRAKANTSGEVQADAGAQEVCKSPNEMMDEAVRDDTTPTHVEAVTGLEKTGPSATGSSREKESPPIEGTADKESTPAASDTGPLDYGCDGFACEREWTWMADIYHCQDCLDIAFCDVHMAEVKSGRRFGTCKGDHTFLYVPPYDEEEAKKIGPEHLKVGDSVMPITEWLRGLKKEWGLEDGR
ncbi:MAG: hypothetical protein M1828_006190 [Chrysothrix sp. TS-e1954]|nr:MAG: hypothetical protein M1828_006190 [Chrysothrix sp. TS-e1954]